MGALKQILLDLTVYWKSLVIVLTPLVLLPYLIMNKDSSEARCAYALLIMAVYWMTEVVPLAVTSFLPIFLFPLLNVLSVKQTCQTYLQDTNFLFFGGLMVAVAVEESNLHKRIALKVLLMMGTRPEWLMCGFMIVTAFLSMWMSNTATTAMMVPIAVAILLELQKEENENENVPIGKGEQNISLVATTANESSETNLGNVSAIALPIDEATGTVDHIASGPYAREMWPVAEHAQDEIKLKPTGIAKGVLLSICYAANIGGTGTLTGTGPNLVLRGQLDQYYKDKDTGITFAYWMLFAIPPMLLCLLFGWILIQIVFFRRNSCFFRCYKSSKIDEKNSDNIKQILKNKYNQLGSISFAEKSVLFWFVILVALWILRDPRFIPGWAQLLGYPTGFISDSSSAMLIGCILFAWPREMPDFYCFAKRDKTRKATSRGSILSWDSMTSKFPWSVIMLLGGGFALAAGVKASGLSIWIGCNLSSALSNLSSFAMLSVFTILITFITEVSSNTATATIFIPIMISLAENLKENPLKFALPATIAPSYAFMLPVATPPNAIVYETKVIKIIEMMLAGVFMNWICIGVILLCMQTYTKLLFPIDTYPDWAAHRNITFCS